MTLKPSSRRGLAAAAGGVLVLGSGMSVGILAADMQHDWTAAEASRQQAAVLADPVAAPPEPVVVIRTKVRHVTPDPVVVHKKVYSSGQAQSPGQGSGGRTTSGSAPQAKSSTRSSRRVITPAPAPARARANPPAATTSKTS
jgi:hypothetical protein